ncbi:MAG TPA: DUF4157 domain-containing protein [Candidatus Binatia bacterium]|nr:DUF4157 domain-containing protein [Candidatus Binatia bacterium]
MSRATFARRKKAVPAPDLSVSSKQVSGSLRVGHPNDHFEREADGVASRIMGSEGGKRDWSVSSMTATPALQRKCECGGSGQCAGCKEQDTLRRKATGPAGAQSVPPAAQEALQSPGHPLDKRARDFFEPRFGCDFSGVRVHADSVAADAAEAVNSAAYTVGHDIVFGSGRYNSTSTAGRELLAHELTHVVQQSRASHSVGSAQEAEAEASRSAGRMVSGKRPAVRLSAPRSMQRQPLTKDVPKADLSENASPLLASAIGSVTLDGFETGKSELSGGNQAKLSKTVETIWKLLKQYPASKIHVIGYTDAVGQENDNQTLGQARADAVQSTLLGLGLPGVAINAESRGANNLLVKTKRAEPRNRRVEVRFEPSTMLRGGLAGGLGSTPSKPIDWHQEGVKVTTNLCDVNPTLCGGKPGIPPTSGTPLDTKPIPDDVPYDLMDVPGLNDAYRSHGQSPSQAGDTRATFARLYKKYRNMGLPEKIAAKLANSEMTSTAGQDQSRDNPNSIDRSNQQMKQDFPGSTTIGPANLPWKLEF